jgi:DNA-binding SARP family transcriptional activator
MMKVHMFGAITMSVDGHRIAGECGPSGRILSGYLFQFIGRVHRRERLADLFWGHLDPERARAALNTGLWRLRRLLECEKASEGGRNLITNGSSVILEPAEWLSIDTLNFEFEVKSLLDRSSYTEVDLHRLQDAVDSYAAPFLEGEDSDWVLEERERLFSLYVRAANELMRELGHLQRYEEAAGVARCLLAKDPFRESVHRDLLILLLLNGQRCEAMRLHERWSALIKDELGVEPMPDTRRIAVEIRSGKIFEELETLRTKHFEPPTFNREYSPGQRPGRRDIAPLVQ